MDKTILIIVIVAIAQIVNGQIKETPLVKIDGKKISQEEFDYIYEKNNSAAQQPITKSEYLELFLNYKLKAAEAHTLGLDTTSEYKRETAYYFNELARPFQYDSLSQKAAEEEFMRRLKTEIDASHILIAVKKDASVKDTVAAYYKAMRVRQEIMDGADFTAVARRVSDDPSVERNGGRLGYFSVMQMVQEFEDAAYETKVGEVTPVFRTDFGYHIMKVHDKRPYSGSVKILHLIKQFPLNNASQAIRDSLKTVIDECYKRIVNGEEFEKVAMECSDDKQAVSDGIWIIERRLHPLIAELGRQAFALTEKGSFSNVFETAIGWHIVKMIDKKSDYTDEEINAMFEVARDRYQPLIEAGLKGYIKGLKKEYGLIWNVVACDMVAEIMNSGKSIEENMEQLKGIDVPLATYHGDRKLMADEVVDAWPIGEENGRKTTREILSDIAESVLFRYDCTQLVNKNSDFRYTMQEYYDGLLVYEINKKTIWSNEDVDSIALARIYASNPQRYSRNAKFNGKIYFCKDESTASKVRKLVVKNPESASKKADKVVEGEYQIGSEYDDYIWPNIPSKFVVVYGTYVKGELKLYDEVKAQLIVDYQQQREVEYIDKLRTKHKVKIIGKLK